MTGNPQICVADSIPLEADRVTAGSVDDVGFELIERTGPGVTRPQQPLQDLKESSLNKEKGEYSSRDEAYSAFGKSSKRWITVLVSLAGFLSPLSANIYFPALDYIAQDLHVSLELMNITITAYLVCQCIVPSIFGDLADMVGRRPVYLLVLLLYFAANLGLTFQHSYAALLVLRMLQSTGASGTIALGVSVIHDIAAPHERGKYMGAAMSGYASNLTTNLSSHLAVLICATSPNTAPSLGPVLGGVLTEKAGWRWIFGFLSILSGSSLVFMFIFFPETGRNIVGDGSVPPRGLNRTLMSHVRRNPNSESSEAALVRPVLRFPNPTASLRIIFHKDTSLLLYANGIFYMNYQCIQASLSPLFIRIYRLNALQAGLCYLPYGIGCTFASYITGLIIDRDYRKTAASVGFTIDKVRGDDLARFPIEQARLRSAWYFMAVSITCTVGYGWALETKTVLWNLAVPLVLQVLCGLTVTGTFNVLRTLMIDLHPSNPATASASVNIIRGAVAVIGVSVLQLLLDRLGVGWTFSLLAALCATAFPVLWAEWRWGMGWRTMREARAKEKEKEQRDEKAPVEIQP